MMILCAGALPVLLWKCWPRSLRGLNTRPWPPYLRSPRNLRSPCFPRAWPTRAGTSCGRCLWRRSGAPQQMCSSATPSSRAASESPHLPGLPRPRCLPSTPARPLSRTPPPMLSSKAPASLKPPATSPITSVCLCQDYSPTSSSQIPFHRRRARGTLMSRESSDCSQTGEGGATSEQCLD